MSGTNGTKQDVSRLNGRSELTPRQELVACFLAAGLTIEEAARKTKCGASTIKAWLAHEPEMKARMREILSEMKNRAVGMVVDAMADAVKTLRALLKSESEFMRHKAADTILTRGTELAGIAELQARVEALESKRR